MMSVTYLSATRDPYHSEAPPQPPPNHHPTTQPPPAQDTHKRMQA